MIQSDQKFVESRGGLVQAQGQDNTPSEMLQSTQDGNSRVNYEVTSPGAGLC